MMYGSRLLETEVNLGLKLWLVLPHGQYTNIQSTNMNMNENMIHTRSTKYIAKHMLYVSTND